jgi:predicted transcriptional regulator
MATDPDFATFHLDRPGIRKVLGDLEAEIMELVWTRPTDQGTTVREIWAILYERRGLAYTTVMSTMQRLAKKGVLRVVKDDQAYIYFPQVSQEQFVARFVRQIVDDLLASFSGPTLDALTARPNAAEADHVQRLRDAIARRRASEEQA